MNQLTNLPSADISAQHEQDAKDLTRILPASKKFMLKVLAQISKFHFVKLA
jgi:phosphomethylpyrimidine synthase